MAKRLFVLAMLAAALTPISAFGHVESENGALSELTVLIVEPDIFSAGVETPIFLEIKKRATGEKLAGLKVDAAVEDTNGQEIFSGKAQEQTGNYVFSYTFPKGGDYTIHADFIYDGQEQDFDFKVFVSEPEQETSDIGLIITVITGAFILIVLGFGITKKKLKMAVIWAIIIAVAGLLAYSLYVTLKANPSAGVVTCVQSGDCFWTAHVHAYVPISICGEDLRLPTEVGRPLSRPHTHEEKNTIHWHDRLPYDKTTQSILETEPLTLGAFFDAINIQFENAAIAAKENGDLCPDGFAGTVKIFANGELVPDNARAHIWRDKDVIAIFFDSRTIEEIAAELKVNPIAFPKLGRG